MKLKRYIKREFEAMGMSGKERAFVITLVIMLCMVVSFIIIRVNNKPEEIWVEIPPAEEIAKLLEEEKLPQDSQEENSVTDNTPVTTRSYNEADSRIKQAEDLKSLDDLLAEQQGQETNSQGENAPEEGEGTTPAKIEPYKVNDGMSFKDLEKYKPQNKDEKKANKRTLISYYLVGREAVAELPNPVYTCEQSGKVVINITVDDQGRVIEASYNKASSNTTNGCLIDNAIYYARKARFNKDSKNKQLGTITYLFQWYVQLPQRMPPLWPPLCFRQCLKLFSNLFNKRILGSPFDSLKSSLSKKAISIPMRILWSMKKINRFLVHLSITMVPI